MTLAEFKAWFDGYTENVDKQPTQKQWARIKDRVAEIDGTAVTERVYIDRYWPIYRQPYFGSPVWTTCGTVSSAAATVSNSAGSAVTTSVVQMPAFNAESAMYALGREEARVA